MSLALSTNADPFALARDLFFRDSYGRKTATFAPTFDVKETPDAFVLVADVPGVDEKDLEIAVHNGVLTVSGNRSAEERKDGERYSIVERRYGAFARSFSLPELADAERIEAKLDRGVLVLTIAKRAEAKPRKIAIKPASGR
jgi:HSP20 family protein